MNQIKVYLNNNTIVGYSVGEVGYSSIEVIQDELDFKTTKLEGYKIENLDGVFHLKFDENKYNNFINKSNKEINIEKGKQKSEKLAERLVFENASDEDAYIMRYLYPTWSAENIAYKKGQRLMYEDKFYKVLQDHNSSDQWLPNNAPSLYVEISNPEIEYPEFKQPTNAEDAYILGAKITFNGKKYISLINGNTWSPAQYPAGWQLVEENNESGSEEIPVINEYPDFIQPSNAETAYKKGAKVTYNGKKYISLIDNNTWSPQDYPAGWKLVE